MKKKLLKYKKKAYYNSFKKISGWKFIFYDEFLANSSYDRVQKFYGNMNYLKK